MQLGRGPAEPAQLLDDVDRAYVVSRLEGELDEPVRLRLAVRPTSSLVLPGREPEPRADEMHQAETLVRELAALEPRLAVEIEDVSEGATGEAAELPALTVEAPGGGGLRFLGVPRANIFRALLEAIRRASTREWGLARDQQRTLDRVRSSVSMRVFATAICPSCPAIMETAIGVALASPWVRADVIDGVAFDDLVLRYDVYGVPTVVLNDALMVEGPVSVETLLEFILHSADPSHPAPRSAKVPFRSCGRLER